jgi:hypothetical protein
MWLETSTEFSVELAKFVNIRPGCCLLARALLDDLHPCSPGAAAFSGSITRDFAQDQALPFGFPRQWTCCREDDLVCASFPPAARPLMPERHRRRHTLRRGCLRFSDSCSGDPDFSPPDAGKPQPPGNTGIRTASPFSSAIDEFSKLPDKEIRKARKRAKIEQPKPPKTITAGLRFAQILPTGALLVELEGGQLWIQTSPGTVSEDPGKAKSVTLRRNSLGSYFMKLDIGSVSVAAKRLR